MEQRVDDDVIGFKPFGRHYVGDEVLVMRSQVTHVTACESNGNHGTKIHFIGGTSVIVGEWVSDVEKTLRN